MNDMTKVKTALQKYLLDVHTNEAKIAALCQIGWRLNVTFRYALRHPVVAYHMWRMFRADRKDRAAA